MIYFTVYHYIWPITGISGTGKSDSVVAMKIIEAAKRMKHIKNGTNPKLIIKLIFLFFSIDARNT